MTESSRLIPIQIQPKTIYGFRSDIVGNIHFTAREEVIYPVSGVLAFHNYATGKQKFLRLPENCEINIVTISPSRKMLAIAERNAQKAYINIYEIGTFKRRRTISFPNEIATKEVASMSFTNDSKGFAILSREPDSQLILMFFDKTESTVIGRVSHSTHQLGVARYISCNLSDTGMVAIGGDYVFKVLNKTEKGFAPVGTIKGDGVVVTSLAWITGEILLAGTADGDLLLVENGDLKITFDATEVAFLDLTKIADDEGEDGRKEAPTMTRRKPSIGESKKPNREVACLTHFSTGFCYALHNVVHVFEKESNYKYQKKSIISIPVTLYDRELYKIANVAINQAQDTVMVSCAHSQIYIGQLFVPESVTVNSLEFRTLGEPLHIARIVSLAVCMWKPIVVTISEDKTVRVWNYVTGRVELVKKYLVNITVIALHPSGIFVALGFSDHLRFMEILLDDLKTVKEYNFPKCRVAVFSHKGHMLAVSFESTIEIISVFSFDIIQTLRSHNGMILSLMWAYDDIHFLSAGQDGAIYEWNAITGERMNEVVQKEIQYRSLAVTGDLSAVYAITNSGVLREICKSEIVRETKIPDLPPLTCLTLARSDLVMFIASEQGHIFNVQLPFMETGGGTCTNYRFFSSSITCMKITNDDALLIIGADDGTLAIWEILNNEGKKAPVDDELGKCVDVLIPREELLDRLNAITSLEQRMDQQADEYEFQLKRKDEDYTKQIAQIHAEYREIIEDLKDKNRKLEADHIDEINIITASIAELKFEHQKALTLLETDFHQKIIVEYEKTSQVKKLMETMKDDYEVKLRKTAGHLQDTVQSLETDFRKQLDERQTLIKLLIKDAEEKGLEFKEYSDQVTMENERKVVNMTVDYEKKIKHEQQIGNKWRGEAGVLSKKYNLMNKSNKKLKTEIETVTEEHERLKENIQQLENTIQEMETTIGAKDNVIRDRDHQISDLQARLREKSAIQEAQEVKLKELNAQIEPRDEEIRIGKDKRVSMEIEMQALQRKNRNLEHKLKELNEKYIGNTILLKAQLKRSQTLQAKLFRMSGDIAKASDIIQDPPKLKELAKKLLDKYTKDFDPEQVPPAEEARSLSGRTSKLSARVRKPRESDEAKKLLQQNMELIKNLETLRAELNDCKRRNRRMESFLGIPGHPMPRLARERYEKALADFDEIDRLHREELDALRLIIEELERRLVCVSEE
ncbi:cilia- and flagella-associated protein 57 [Phlebotomus argentipes]|uniref:cilia- and flagella-associated protein 57 n=1 Tax=Phlebotomus argentipes TaxID=94469 RepID=UPI002892D506|nr:cilia- and flagella-associated protein 57 [Phlebotomus argentipes]